MTAAVLAAAHEDDVPLPLLLREAEEQGLLTISGAEMFIYQAVLQFEEFTGETAPEGVMRRVVMEHLTG